MAENPRTGRARRLGAASLGLFILLAPCLAAQDEAPDPRQGGHVGLGKERAVAGHPGERGRGQRPAHPGPVVLPPDDHEHGHVHPQGLRDPTDRRRDRSHHPALQRLVGDRRPQPDPVRRPQPDQPRGHPGPAERRRGGGQPRAGGSWPSRSARPFWPRSGPPRSGRPRPAVSPSPDRTSRRPRPASRPASPPSTTSPGPSSSTPWPRSADPGQGRGRDVPPPARPSPRRAGGRPRGARRSRVPHRGRRGRGGRRRRPRRRSPGPPPRRQLAPLGGLVPAGPGQAADARLGPVPQRQRPVQPDERSELQQQELELERWARH